jgi:hypothetical protein
MEEIEYIGGIKFIKITGETPNNLSEEDKASRIDICNSCPFKKDDICTKCGCIIAVKTSFEYESCPEGKW